jgi:hypothetical protein
MSELVVPRWRFGLVSRVVLFNKAHVVRLPAARAAALLSTLPLTGGSCGLVSQAALHDEFANLGPGTPGQEVAGHDPFVTH